MMKYYRAILFFVFIMPIYASAQIQTAINVGSGLMYAGTKNMGTYYKPVIRPDVLASLFVPFSNTVSLQAGIGYTIKGFNTVQQQDFGNSKDIYTTKERLQYLSIPLLMSFKTFGTKNIAVYADGGMDYNFFIKGNLSYQYQTYHGEKLITDVGETYSIKGHVNSGKFSATHNSYDVNALDVAGRIQLRLVYKERYILTLYHEHSFYEMRSDPSDDSHGTLKLRSTGIMIGCRLF
ncbi:MAG: outer membrane beta-barrel protein [Bacteroidetes bacterium]|nr:outer membrane beta-barrel protein [Bacteroidota bacterium]